MLIRRAGAVSPTKPFAPARRTAVFLNELSGLAQETGRTGTDRVAWIQRNLNLVTGGILVVDGIPGPKTQRAISNFQGSSGLVVDGIFGPVTEAALMAAVAVTRTPACYLLDQPSEDVEEFAFADHNLRTFHQPQILNVARCVVASQKTAAPIRSIRLVGHTDPVGNESYNFQLGLRRAAAVKKQLLATVDRMSPGLSKTLQVVESSRGEKEPVAASKTRSRRVQVVVPTTTSPPMACTCSGFFREYELRFNPGSPNFGIPANRRMNAAQKAQRSSEVRAMVGELLPRRDRRAADALAGVTTAATPVTGTALAIARRLSAAQAELYRTCFPDGRKGINFLTFRSCFEKFANGDLRDPAAGAAVGERGVGEPDGGFYFLFAEFAFLCLDSGIDTHVWGEVLRIFVGTQEIFMHVYRPAPKLSAAPAVTAASPVAGPRLRGLDTYDNANFNAVAQSNGARRAALRAKYAGMTLPALRTAARDNMITAQCAP